MPWPTPMHIVQSAYLPPVRSNWYIAVVIRRAPLAPRGCPRAIAPPLGFTWLASSATPSSRSTARACEAKASFSSMTSIWPTARFVFAKTLREAGAGPMPIMRGATPAAAAATTRALGANPWRLTAASEASSRAQAPSFTPEAFPAVTVPPGFTMPGNFESAAKEVSARAVHRR